MTRTTLLEKEKNEALGERPGSYKPCSTLEVQVQDFTELVFKILGFLCSISMVGRVSLYDFLKLIALLKQAVKWKLIISVF